MSDDATTALNAPVVENGLERIPFFNGRVLTAEDLKTEQEANATERHRLGRALGSGVLEGLFVRLGDTPNTVTVEAGQALAPSGRVLELPREVTLSVVSELDSSLSAGTEGTFEACSTQDTVVTSGAGVYLLVAEPAAEPRGRVPRTGLQGDGAAGECGAKFRKMGARLCLVHVDTEAGDLVPRSLRQPIRTKRGTIEGTLVEGEEPDPADVSKLRNLLAHVCLGTPEALAEPASLYDTLRDVAQGRDPGSSGALERLRRSDHLSHDAVPLGLLYWAGERIRFIDNWSVRRRVHRMDSQRTVPFTHWHRARGEAAFFQFQDQLAGLVEQEASEGFVDIRMTDCFRFLPSVCMIPRVNSNGVPGIVPEFFLGQYPARNHVDAEGRRLPQVMEQSLLTPPVDLVQRTALRTYHIRENEAQREVPDTVRPPVSGSPTPYLLLVDGSLPFIGDSRFDLAHWGYAQFPQPAEG